MNGIGICIFAMYLSVCLNENLQQNQSSFFRTFVIAILNSKDDEEEIYGVV